VTDTNPRSALLPQEETPTPAALLTIELRPDLDNPGVRTTGPAAAADDPWVSGARSGDNLFDEPPA